jgi:uncharacterized protein YegP (UPF0339 family)
VNHGSQKREKPLRGLREGAFRNYDQAAKRGQPGSSGCTWILAPLGHLRPREEVNPMTFEVRDAAGGQFYWRIVASNGEPLAHSETYRHKVDCEKAVQSVKANAWNASVVDKTAGARAMAALRRYGR